MAQKSIAQVRNYSLEQLKNIVRQLIEINKKTRENKSDALAILSLLLVRV